MGERQFRPGHRNNSKLSPYGNRRLSEDRFGWVRTFLGQFVILTSVSKDDMMLNVTLFHPRERGAPVTLGLTECTEEELLAMKELFDKAFELALPTTRRRDKVAHDAFQRGDDSYARSYRQIPQLVYREGALGTHSEGVQERPESVSPSGWGGLPDDGGVRGAGDELAKSDPQGSESEDDGPTPD